MAKKENKEKNENKQKRRFFKDMKAELKKVIWPNAKQTANNTIAVIAFTLAIAVIVFVLDVVFDFANKKGVVALQEKVKSSYSTSNTTEEASDENATSEENSENKSEENADSDKSENSSEKDNGTDVKAEAETDDQTKTEKND